jgi:putative hemolysin
MQPIAAGVLIIAGLIVAQGLLVLAEAALNGARKSLLKDRAARGDRGAEAAIRLGEDPRRFTPALQAGVIFLSSLAGVYAGVVLEPILNRALPQGGPLSSHADAISIGAIALAIASATLIFGDLIPRRLALHRPESIARLLSRPTRVLANLIGPLVGILGAATARALRIVGVRPSTEAPVTEEEIQELMQEGTRAGVFEEAEHEMVKRVLRFSDRRARALMTPRNQIVWIDLADPPEEIRRKVSQSPHSRFLVCDQSLDNLLGIVHVKDLLGQGQDVEPFRLKGHLTLPLFLYEGTRGLKILEMLRASGSHNAVVLDEYGTVAGLLTLTDILEAIVGDIPDRSEDEEPRAVRRDDGSWLLDGRLPLDEFRDLLDLPVLREGDFHTLAGLVVARLGHIPQVGESFDDWGLHVEVVDMDGNRVDRLLVERVDATRPNNS